MTMVAKYNQRSFNKQTYINYISDIDIFPSIRQRIASGINGSTVIVPHVCNNVNAFGAGFAGSISSHYPEVKENYHLLGANMRLGHTQFISVGKDKTYNHEIIIANMIAQNGIIHKKNPRPLNYAALVQCMLGVRNYSQNIASTHDKTKVEIHAPRFGSGLAGGNWEFIENLIQDIWTNIDIFIYLVKNKK